MREIRLNNEIESPIFFGLDDGASGCVGANEHLVFEVVAELDVLVGLETEFGEGIGEGVTLTMGVF